MSDSRSWFEVVAAEDLVQGDLIANCPVPVASAVGGAGDADRDEYEVRVYIHDLIVLSQTCDLIQAKVKDVVLAQVVSWAAVVESELARGNTNIRSEQFRRNLSQGLIPNLLLLHKHEGELSLPWSLVNFHNVFVLPKEHLAEVMGRTPRLRLRSPWREYLGQAFARYFMRVALPPPELRAFVTEGKVN